MMEVRTHILVWCYKWMRWGDVAQGTASELSIQVRSPCEKRRNRVVHIHILVWCHKWTWWGDVVQGTASELLNQVGSPYEKRRKRICTESGDLLVICRVLSSGFSVDTISAMAMFHSQWWEDPSAYIYGYMCSAHCTSHQGALSAPGTTTHSGKSQLSAKSLFFSKSTEGLWVESWNLVVMTWMLKQTSTAAHSL
ncbi:uncharacterized protein BJ212DRAFT_1296361 [Suillus subaureus]|uniref:Uncharacterized protein n=1 Tax=Suillus subaureus TaxID=48587 RepID=A0A9P7EKX0_9AGAM|nr:uncharacterized protein BJ212DRAFT_1296361 [Suillus subaureus]KAG1823822.1 hypothetical protein BJ212DRAFT_1296361 [Suillus subaureus]